MKRTLSLLSLSLCAAFAQDVKITSGAVEYQVYQRDAGGRAAISIAGVTTGQSVEALLYAIAAPMKLLAKSGAQAGGGKWSMQVNAPTGGPYTHEVRVLKAKSGVKVSNLLVGDLWILAGQSNMEGVADLIDVQPPDPRVNSFDQSDVWVNAKEPLHSLPDSADRVHWRKNAQGQLARLDGEAAKQFAAGRKKGAGLGLPFAVEMVKRTGVPVGLLPCAHGGTSMNQWSPELRDKGGDSLYGSTYRRFKAVGGKVTGILWYQGESDGSPKEAPLFQDKFEKLVAAFRADFGQPDLPFYYVQIGRHVNSGVAEPWNMVQEMQRKAEANMPRTGMVPAVDVDLDDGIHVSTADQKLVGKRLAILALRDLFPKVHAPKRGPRLVSARLADGVLKVAFSDVNGKLVSAGRISGFSVHNNKGELLQQVFKARVDPSDGSVVLLSISGKLPEGAVLHYGFGRNPYCNLRDEAGMGVPVFGPLAIQ